MARIFKSRHIRERQQQRGLRRDMLDFILDFADAQEGEDIRDGRRGAILAVAGCSGARIGGRQGSRSCHKAPSAL